MREIKFRAYLKSAHTMMRVKDIHFQEDEIVIAAFDGAFGGITWFELGNENATLMQYTGLKDKNGVEIYEGDIVESKGELYPSRVVWRENDFCFAFEDWSFEDYFGRCENKPENIEVIGNVHDNPELLEVAR